MAQAERLNHATAFLSKAQEYLASAENDIVAERFTAAAGPIHAQTAQGNNTSEPPRSPRDTDRQPPP